MRDRILIIYGGERRSHARARACVRADKSPRGVQTAAAVEKCESVDCELIDRYERARAHLARQIAAVRRHNAAFHLRTRECTRAHATDDSNWQQNSRRARAREPPLDARGGAARAHARARARAYVNATYGVLQHRQTARELPSFCSPTRERARSPRLRTRRAFGGGGGGSSSELAQFIEQRARKNPTRSRRQRRGYGRPRGARTRGCATTVAAAAAAAASAVHSAPPRNLNRRHRLLDERQKLINTLAAAIACAYCGRELVACGVLRRTSYCAAAAAAAAACARAGDDDHGGGDDVDSDGSGDSNGGGGGGDGDSEATARSREQSRRAFARLREGGGARRFWSDRHFGNRRRRRRRHHHSAR